MRAVLGVALPLVAAAVLAATAFLWIAPGVNVAAMSRGVIGPTTWPKAMLLAAAVCAALLVLARLAGQSGRGSDAPEGGTVDYHEARSLGAIGLVIAYGVAIPFIGIAWSTPLFIAGWLLLGGVRAPLRVALVSILGTVGLLYFFVKLSLMPLDRGKGVFEQASVALYRLLGIY